MIKAMGALIKFSGTKLPGSVEINGRQYYDDAVGELKEIESKIHMNFLL